MCAEQRWQTHAPSGERPLEDLEVVMVPERAQVDRVTGRRSLGRLRAAWPVALCAMLLCACGGGTGEAAIPLPNAPSAIGVSSVARASPAAAPVLIAAPQPLVVADGEPAMFIVLAHGPGLQYRWLVNGATVVGVGGSVLQLHAAMRADDGAQIAVVVSNPEGQFATPPVRLTVEPAGWRAPWS